MLHFYSQQNYYAFFFIDLAAKTHAFQFVQLIQ